MVRARLRRELGHHGADRTVHLIVELIGDGLRAAHDVALDVAAAAERGQQRFVDRGDRFLDVALEHAVQLEVLASGHAQRSVGPFAADFVVGDVRIR